MSDNITSEIEFYKMECLQCGTYFFLQANLIQFRRKDGLVFYCPNGHQSYYTTRDDWQKVKASTQERMERAEEYVETLSAKLERIEGDALCWEAFRAERPQEASELAGRALASKTWPTLFQLLRQDNSDEGLV